MELLYALGEWEFITIYSKIIMSIVKAITFVIRPAPQPLLYFK